MRLARSHTTMGTGGVHDPSMASRVRSVQPDGVVPAIHHVRYLHGRIGTSGTIQIDVGDGSPGDEPPVAHFRAFWTRAFAGFLANASTDRVPVGGGAIGFAPELLPAAFGYALEMPGPDGERRELGDRWEQGLVLTRIASECFAEAEASD